MTCLVVCVKRFFTISLEFLYDATVTPKEEDHHRLNIQSYRHELRELESAQEALQARVLNSINAVRRSGVSWDEIAEWAGWNSKQAAWDWHRRETERRT